MIAVPGFVEFTFLTVPDNLITELLLCDGLELSESVGFGSRRNDSSVRKPGVSGKSLECRHSPLEVVDELFVRRVSGSIARRVERRDARAMFVPLMLPERLVVSLVVLPVDTSSSINSSAWTRRGRLE